MLSQKLDEERSLFDEWWKNAGREEATALWRSEFDWEWSVGQAKEIAWLAWQQAIAARCEQQ